MLFFDTVQKISFIFHDLPQLRMTNRNDYKAYQHGNAGEIRVCCIGDFRERNFFLTL